MAAPDRTREPTGWVIFAGVMMLLIGFLNFFYGLAAVVNDEVVVVGGHGAIIADLTTWGWVTIVLVWVGHVTVTGAELYNSAGEWGLQAELSDPARRGELTGAEWARWVGVFVVALNAIDQVWIFPAAPLWAFIVILLDVIIIYNLTARWAGTTAL